jgi:RNA-binding protein
VLHGLESPCHHDSFLGSTMLGLSSKQKSYLRGLGQKFRESTSVGKAGMSEQVQAHIRALLTRHELIKIRLLSLNAKERPAAAQEIAKATDATVVGVLGGTMLLYKPNADIKPAKRIKLPQREAT